MSSEESVAISLGHAVRRQLEPIPDAVRFLDGWPRLVVSRANTAQEPARMPMVERPRHICRADDRGPRKSCGHRRAYTRMATDLFGERFRRRLPRALRLDRVGRTQGADSEHAHRLRLLAARPPARLSCSRARGRGALRTAGRCRALAEGRLWPRIAASGRADCASGVGSPCGPHPGRANARVVCVEGRRPCGKVENPRAGMTAPTTDVECVARSMVRQVNR